MLVRAQRHVLAAAALLAHADDDKSVSDAQRQRARSALHPALHFLQQALPHVSCARLDAALGLRSGAAAAAVADHGDRKDRGPRPPRILADAKHWPLLVDGVYAASRLPGPAAGAPQIFSTTQSLAETKVGQPAADAEPLDSLPTLLCELLAMAVGHLADSAANLAHTIRRGQFAAPRFADSEPRECVDIFPDTSPSRVLAGAGAAREMEKKKGSTLAALGA